ncbi:MAG: hypothetical protein JW885_13355 [Deltaproteobacteria bacterium]|nr:hypothetical protein [Candidatus Zymogenaceae bacterium]
MTALTIAEARSIACTIADEYNRPRFYSECESQATLSRNIFNSNSLVESFYSLICDQEDDFGHGSYHSEMVAVDTAAIIAVERGFKSIDALTAEDEMLIVSAHAAGLLHDIKRKQEHHALAGARAAQKILARCDLAGFWQERIVTAIRNHEAFQEQVSVEDEAGRLLSDALYDADKFRWGPDNFTRTLWDMLEYAGIPVSAMLKRYHKSLDGIIRIKDTFRTDTGKAYGPEFIDLGLSIGEEIYRQLQERIEGIGGGTG